MTIIKTLSALAMAGAVIAVAVPAEARQGCGIGYHRGPRGRCIANVRGQFYAGHGYWDGRRYFPHRYRYHNGWRYR